MLQKKCFAMGEYWVFLDKYNIMRARPGRTFISDGSPHSVLRAPSTRRHVLCGVTGPNTWGRAIRPPPPSTSEGRNTTNCICEVYLFLFFVFIFRWHATKRWPTASRDTCFECELGTEQKRHCTLNRRKGFTKNVFTLFNSFSFSPTFSLRISPRRRSPLLLLFCDAFSQHYSSHLITQKCSVNTF